MRKDLELLRYYVDSHDEGAFSELVHRHLDLVWGTARRITKDDDLAKDVTQQVFFELATKGRRLAPNVVVGGWLYRAACLAARKCVRTYVRRSERERSAMDLQQQNQSSSDSPNPETLLPILDEGLESLSKADRSALILRFFDSSNEKVTRTWAQRLELLTTPHKNESPGPSKNSVSFSNAVVSMSAQQHSQAHLESPPPAWPPPALPAPSSQRHWEAPPASVAALSSFTIFSIT